MRYLIAYDPDPENPNPHSWSIDSDSFADEAAALAAIEEERREMLSEGYDEEALPHTLIVATPNDAEAGCLRRTLDMIHALLDGEEWSSDTPADIAQVLVLHGYTIHDLTT